MLHSATSSALTKAIHSNSTNTKDHGKRLPLVLCPPRNFTLRASYARLSHPMVSSSTTKIHPVTSKASNSAMAPGRLWTLSRSKLRMPALCRCRFRSPTLTFTCTMLDPMPLFITVLSAIRVESPMVRLCIYHMYRPLIQSIDKVFPKSKFDKPITNFIVFRGEDGQGTEAYFLTPSISGNGSVFTRVDGDGTRATLGYARDGKFEPDSSAQCFRMCCCPIMVYYVHMHHMRRGCYCW